MIAKMVSVVGIDPGKSGGLVHLGANGVILDMTVMPLPHVLADWLENLQKYVSLEPKIGLHIFLEKAQAMPKNGAVGMFNYGCHYGQIEGILIALKMSHTLVHPKTWTKVMHSGTAADKPKIRSLEASYRLAPGVRFKEPESSSKKQHEGLVDAYLIAEYGRRQLSSGGE